MRFFELIKNSGLGRLGKLMSSHGTVITPELMPVYNPNIPLISTKELIEDFDIKILITNAYIINRTETLKANAEQGIHELIDFPRTIMLDSGAYQAWMYKKELQVSNKEIIEFQEILNPDIATILDVFTDTDDYQIAKNGVVETIKRAKQCIEIRDNSDGGTMWAAPIQGGKFFDLIDFCAKRLSELDFNYHPIGTLAPALMNYNYRPVLQAIATAKINMNVSRPLHAFSIGHPMFFALSVLFGSDLFDSSSYALYAKGERYITPTATLDFNDLQEFPCSCPTCLKYSPEEIRELEKQEKIKLLAKHNLHACLDEMKRIREAIRQDSLWELVQSRVRAHPNLLDAYIHSLLKFKRNFEINDPITKKTAFFYVGKDSLFRPEVLRHSKRLLTNYSPPKFEGKRIKILILLPDILTRPIESSDFQEWMDKINLAIENNPHLKIDDIHVCIISPVFGIIPSEIYDTYPLSQYLYPNIFLEDLKVHVGKSIIDYLRKFHDHYQSILILYPKAQIENYEIVNYPLLKQSIINEKLSKSFDLRTVETIGSLQKMIEKYHA
ncbi:MAG: tRNA guanosine(15) transglycosylase TgtA [Candidatus Lokiarchaeota archaeon]|nr:tRNA guanosine(15) transglycosylase TgtA [Candidatus Lokiarchaeota archaeon]